MPKVSVGRAELDTRPHILYRFYDRTGVLLYVGITVDFDDRWKNHARYKDWWAQVDHTLTKVEYCLGERAARVAETAAIKAEKPLHNSQHNEFVELPGLNRSNLASDLLGDLYEDISGYMATDEIADRIASEIRANHPLLSEHEIQVKVCSHIVRDLWLSRADLATAARRLLHLLPDGLGDDALDVANTKLSEQDDGDGFDNVLLVSEALFEGRGLLSNLYLEKLPEAERLEWIACARTALTDGADSYTVVRQAAEHAATFKSGRGRSVNGMCANSGDHGAMCPNLATNKIWLDDCHSCTRTKRPCRGHVGLCDRHLDEAQRGLARRAGGELYALTRAEVLPPESVGALIEDV